MSNRPDAEIVDHDVIFTMTEVCERLPADSEFVVRCVEFGIAHAEGRDPQEWCFSFSTVRRLQKASRLQRDLEMDFAGLAMVLDLLDDVETMRRQVESLEKRLRQWEG